MKRRRVESVRPAFNEKLNNDIGGYIFGFLADDILAYWFARATCKAWRAILPPRAVHVKRLVDVMLATKRPEMMDALEIYTTIPQYCSWHSMGWHLAADELVQAENYRGMFLFLEKLHKFAETSPGGWLCKKNILANVAARHGDVARENLLVPYFKRNTNDWDTIFWYMIHQMDSNSAAWMVRERRVDLTTISHPKWEHIRFVRGRVLTTLQILHRQNLLPFNFCDRMIMQLTGTEFTTCIWRRQSVELFARLQRRFPPTFCQKIQEDDPANLALRTLHKKWPDFCSCARSPK